jgi:ABC-2 type transport system permease protein
MRVFNIMIKEIKGTFRDKMSISVMILFPIVLMSILGFAFSSTFEGGFKANDIKVIYYNAGEGEISSAFDEFIKAGQEAGIEFVRADDKQKGINAVRNAEYANFILLDGDGIMVYKNDMDDIYSNIVESMLSGFVDRYKAISIIARENPIMLADILEDDSYDFADVVSLDGERQPASMDYYSVTMLTLIVLYASITGMHGVDNERTRKTGNRMLASPIRKYEILIGKLLGIFIATLVQTIIVFLFSRYILGAYWGTNIIAVFLIIMSEVLFSISIGIGLGFVIKNGNAGMGVVQTLIPFIAFLGGAYVPLDTMNSEMLTRVSVISPVRWTNAAIFGIIFAKDYSTMPVALLINILTAALFIAMSAYMFKKEAF